MRIKRINEGMPDSAFNRLKQYAPRNYVVDVYWDVENPLGYHYEINSGKQVYTKVKSNNGYLGHFMIDSKPQNNVEEMENYAKKLIDKYDCKEVSNAEYERIVNESLTESFEEEYNNCFVEFRDGNPSFAYDDYRDAVRGMSMSRMGDVRMNSDYEEHKYEIKYLKDGIYYDVDDSGKIVKESLKEGTVVGGELLSNLPDGYWNR